MKKWCPYCASLHSAIDGANYCSQQGDRLEAAKSNAFYLRTRQLNSGKHFSRWTIRAVLDGYQLYHKQQSEHLLQANNYLLIGEGESYSSEIESELEVEALIVAFQPTFIGKGILSYSQSPTYLLDYPDETLKDPPDFWTSLYPRTLAINQLFYQLRDGIVKQEKSPLFYEETFFDLLTQITRNHFENEQKQLLIPARKKAVREELLRRLSIAKDFIDTQLSEKITLEEISHVSCLSPFHFLRLFRKVYQMTPFQYLSQERIKYAQYLLRHSSQSIQAIGQTVGFEDQGAFARSFKRYSQLTPGGYRGQSINGYENVI